MEYCDRCAKAQQWPKSALKHVGRCEVCRRAGKVQGARSGARMELLTGYMEDGRFHRYNVRESAVSSGLIQAHVMLTANRIVLMGR